MTYLSNENLPGLKSKVLGAMPEVFETSALLKASDPTTFEVGALGIVLADADHGGSSSVYRVVAQSVGGSYDQTDNLLVNQTYLTGFKTEDDYWGSWKGDAATATWNGTTSDSRGFGTSIDRSDLLSGFDGNTKDYSVQFQALDAASPTTVKLSYSGQGPWTELPTDGTNLNLPKGNWASALGGAYGPEGLMWGVPGQVPCNFNIRLYEGLDHPQPQITGRTTTRIWQYIGDLDQTRRLITEQGAKRANNLPQNVLSSLVTVAHGQDSVTINAIGNSLDNGGVVNSSSVIPGATTTQAGVMTAAQVTKLDNLEATIGDIDTLLTALDTGAGVTLPEETA